MMKQKFILLTVLILAAALVTSVKAQVPEAAEIQTASQAEADYRYQFDLYRNSYNNYLITKSEYLETGSLRAEQEALAAAKTTATARTDVLRSYNRWIMLQIIEVQSSLPVVSETLAELVQQENWYLDHKAQIQNTTTVSSFESVMDEYEKEQKNRDKLYATAQIDLKLAKIATFQKQMRELYDPILIVLEPQKNVPEVEQGLARIVALAEQINNNILEARTKAGAIKSGDLEVIQGLRQTSDRLEQLRNNQLSLINIMIELETRYVRN